MLLEVLGCCVTDGDWRSLLAGTCCHGRDLGQGKDQAGIEVPVPREAQSIMFSPSFPQIHSEPSSLSATQSQPLLAEVEGSETERYPWCDGNRQGSGKERGPQPLPASRDSTQQQWCWAPAAPPSALLLVGQLHKWP